MSRRWQAVMAAMMASAWFLVGAGPSRAQIAVASFKSADAILADSRYLASSSPGAKASFQKAEEFLARATGGKGLDGLDGKRPLGIYVNWPDKIGDLDSLEFPIVGFVPVADEKRFLDLFDKLGCKTGKADGGGRQVTVPFLPAPLHLRFAKGHAYLATKRVWLQGELADPAALAPAGGQKSTLLARLHVERIPKEYHKIVDEVFKLVTEATSELAGEGKKKAGESDADFKQRLAFVTAAKAFPERVKRGLVGTIEQTREITLSFEVDQKQHKLTLDLTLVPRDQTGLAKAFEFLAGSKSRFSYLTRRSTLGAFLHVPPFGSVSKSTEPTDEIPEYFGSALPLKYRAVILKSLQVILPTLGADGLDTCFALRSAAKKSEQDDEQISLAGLKVRNGKQIDQIVRDLVREMPAEEQKKLAPELNHARHGGARIHKFKLEDEECYLAVRDDVVFLGLGKHVLPALKEALDGFGKEALTPTPLLEVHAANELFFDDKSPEKRDAGLKPDQRGARLSLAGGKDARLHVELDVRLLGLLVKYLGMEDEK